MHNYNPIDKYTPIGYICQMSSNECQDESHPSHKKQLSRLNRISGQIEGVKRMIDEQRYCPEILTQLRAIRSAVKSLEAAVLKKHLNSCVAEAFVSGSKKTRDKKVEELTAIFQKYS